jgi:hypothetical protein
MREVVMSQDPRQAIVALLGLPRLIHSKGAAVASFLTSAATAIPVSGPVLEALAAEAPDERRPPRRPPGHSLPVRRITELVQSNNVGLAVQAVESAFNHTSPVDPAAARTEVARKFPEGTEQDILPTGTDPSTSLQLEMDQVADSLSGLPRLRAASFTGWTCDIVRALGKGAPEFVSAITGLFNSMLKGSAGPAALWSLDYVFTLIKNDGGVRPIVIGEIFPRILGRIVARQLSPEAAELLAPRQWGIGIPGGTETVAHAIALFYRASCAPGSNSGIQTVDFSNAFNSIRRSAVDAAVARHFPSLLCYFRYSYGTAVSLRDPDGLPVATSATGVRQGDPLGPLLFCLGIDRTLQEVKAEYPSVHLLGLLDDITLLGPDSDLPGCLAALGRKAALIGLSVNRSKSVRLRTPATPASSSSTAPPVVTGARVLGCSIGPDQWVVHQTAERIAEYSAILRPVMSLPPQIATAILQCAVNARPVYTARTTVPPLAAGPFVTFDADIDNALAFIACTSSATLPRHAQIIRALPQAKGGLAIPRIADISPYAFTASLLSSCQSLQTRAPELANFLSACARNLQPAFENPRAIFPAGLVEMPNTEPPMFLPRPWATPAEVSPELNEEEESSDHHCPKQRVLCANLHAAYSTELEFRLTNFPAMRALHRSASFKGSAAPFYSIRTNQHRLSAGAMQVALSSRLLVTPARLHHLSRCRTCGLVIPDDPSCLTHGYNCQALQGLRTSRHNRVRDVLADLLRRLVGPQAVHVEAALGTSVFDLTLDTGLRTFFIDVSIVNPASLSYVLSAADNDDAAALQRAQEKRLRYADALAARGIDPNCLVPFVFETSGRLGPEARAFLDEIRDISAANAPTRNATNTIKFFCDRMRHALLEGNAVIVQQAWSGLLPLQPPSGHSLREVVTGGQE